MSPAEYLAWSKDCEALRAALRACEPPPSPMTGQLQANSLQGQGLQAWAEELPRGTVYARRDAETGELRWRLAGILTTQIGGFATEEEARETRLGDLQREIEKSQWRIDAFTAAADVLARRGVKP